MDISTFLSHFECVRKTSPGSWAAKCPSHEDKHPSLSIKETSEQKILIHCWAGCSPAEILSSIGLEFSDLYPDSVKAGKIKKLPFSPIDALRGIRQEATVLLLASYKLQQGPLNETDKLRLELANQRINAAVQFLDKDHL